MALRRAVQQLSKSPSLSHLSSHSHASSSLSLRHMSQLAKSPEKQQAFLVDTLALFKGFESRGVPSAEAEAHTYALNHIMNEISEINSKFEMSNVPSLSSFKSRVQSLQENHYTSVEAEFEKLRNDMANALREVRCEIAQREARENVVDCCTVTLLAMSAVGLILYFY